MRKLISCCLLMASQFALASACETHRQVMIDNDDTKIWKTKICPRDLLPFHSHEHPRIAIAEESGQLKVIYQSGKESMIHLEKGKPVFLSKAQGLEMHQDINTGNDVMHITIIELKKS